MRVDNMENIDALYQYVADLILKHDKSAREVRKALVEQGLSEDAAKTIVKQVTDEIAKARRKEASKDLALGGVICGIGLFVTIVSLFNASGGGTYVVAYGAIIVGAVKLIKGFSTMSKL